MPPLSLFGKAAFYMHQKKRRSAVPSNVTEAGCIPEGSLVASFDNSSIAISDPTLLLYCQTTRLMYRNVMSPTTARRLGACLKNTQKLHHVLRMSTTAIRQQKLASDHFDEHLDRLALLQAEDQRKLKPVKSKIKDYDAILSKSLDFLTTLPAALEPLTRSSGTVHTSVERAIAITEAQAQLRKLKDATLPNLLKHVEDLELEPYPEPGMAEDEIDFLSRVGGMNDAERKDLLDTLDMQRTAAIAHVTENLQNLQWKEDLPSVSGSDAGSEATVERKENPFARISAKVAASTDTGKKGAEEKPKFGMSTDDQFASVIADAASPEDDFKARKIVGKNFGVDDLASVVADAPSSKDDFKARKIVGKNFGVGQNSGEITTWRPEPAEKLKTVEPRGFSDRSDEDDTTRPTWEHEAADKPKTIEPRVFSHRSNEDDKRKPETPARNLSVLQAQLEASFKKS